MTDIKIGQEDSNTFPNKKILEDIIESFSETTGLGVSLTDLDGIPVIDPGSSRMPDFCKIIRCSAEYKCYKSYATAGREAVKWDEPYVFRCHAGLIGLAVPVFMNTMHIGNIVCGLSLNPTKRTITQVIVLSLGNFI
ncbi:PocR ligand-binding domain-containing protein [Desulfitibacter alkalitolerans]|uniref:PocR ligand-binding domain-containing protein n=1 Tax=Desulfitibacter alkalitolerans TaxID=264641 RepID=UPI000488508D|nr:PocR ligand-binding domain-containing protein [Desulfitibacter alkalitolerans]